ncbi:MAG: ABC transporter ATP-binding protein [Clostridia bacterium]|nr:ABC transporter ATP-binding protein [Clostridia bacterium]
MLTAHGLYKSYGTQEVLRGISLSLADGEFLSVMGESGSGKSTLLAVLAGNTVPDRGQVFLDGEEITAMKEKELARLRRTKLGFVYQELNLISTLSGEDNILLPIIFSHGDLTAARRTLRTLAEKLEISHLLDRLPAEMSGGERQRTAIARAMIHAPSVLMLDEPTGSLDSRNTEEVISLLLRLQAEDGVSILRVTHSRLAAERGDRVIVVRDGLVQTEAL